MREDLPQQSTHQVPQIPRPHPLYGIALHKLRKNGVYSVAKPAEQGAPFGSGISLLGRVGCQQLNAPPGQLFFNLGRVVVAIPHEQTGGALGEFGENRELVGVGWSHRQTGDNARPTDPQVYPEAVEGLLEEGVLAEGGLSPLKRWQRWARANRHAGRGKESARAKPRDHEGSGPRAPARGTP